MNTRSRRPRPAHLNAEQRLRTGRRLAALRRDAGVSQAALARALGRPQNAVSRLETGNTPLLFSEAVEIADALHVDVRLIDPATALPREVRDAGSCALGRGGHQLRLPLHWGATTAGAGD